MKSCTGPGDRPRMDNKRLFMLVGAGVCLITGIAVIFIMPGWFWQTLLAIVLAAAAVCFVVKK